MDKHGIAQIFDEIAILLELKGENPFKIRAYHNASRTLEDLEEDIETLVNENRLTDFPGIGKAIAEKITTLVLTDHLPYYEKLRKSIPETLLELLQVPGLGGKKIKILYEQLKIKNIEQLATACQKGKVAKLEGFGVKSQENILKNIKKLKSYAQRALWISALDWVRFISEKLSKLKEVKKVEVAGSFRRKLETVGDLDFLAAASKPERVMDWFTRQPWVELIVAKGSTKSSIRLKGGLQADLRVVPENEFAFALVYFTGSKDFNIKLRQRANRLGFSLNEYGLFALKGKQRPAIPKKSVTETDVFKALKLSYIPPELRENMGELEMAEKGKLPRLVQEGDIRGVFHCHTTDSDGHNTLEEMVEAAQLHGWEYIGIADHSKSSYQANGMDEERLFQQVDRIDELNKKGRFSTYVFAGLECDILTDGRLDFPGRVLKELDYVVASVHRSFNLDEKKMTARLVKAIENPYTTMIGHVTGRLLLKREPYAVNLTKVIDACIANKKIIELNAHPMRLDLDWRYWHKAAERGLTCSINPDAHHTSDLNYYRTGINIARKGWLKRTDILNTLPLNKIFTYFST
ncbi:MAG: DNA polymerase/3'-5' exonuclease PolX [Chlamydiales bacterium]